MNPNELACIKFDMPSLTATSSAFSQNNCDSGFPPSSIKSRTTKIKWYRNFDATSAGKFTDVHGRFDGTIIDCQLRRFLQWKRSESANQFLLTLRRRTLRLPASFKSGVQSPSLSGEGVAESACRGARREYISCVPAQQLRGYSVGSSKWFRTGTQNWTAGGRNTKQWAACAQFEIRELLPEMRHVRQSDSNAWRVRWQLRWRRHDIRNAGCKKMTAVSLDFEPTAPSGAVRTRHRWCHCRVDDDTADDNDGDTEGRHGNRKSESTVMNTTGVVFIKSNATGVFNVEAYVWTSQTWTKTRVTCDTVSFFN